MLGQTNLTFSGGCFVCLVDWLVGFNLVWLVLLGNDNLLHNEVTHFQLCMRDLNDPNSTVCYCRV